MQKDSRVVQRNKKHFLIHSIALSLISAPVNGCVLMWCIQQFWLKNMTAITDPTFLGERGAASLNQYFGMQQILPELKDNTAVYVVSPQWFTKKGYDSSAFNNSLIAIS